MNGIMFTVGNAWNPEAIKLLLRMLSTVTPFVVIKYKRKAGIFKNGKISYEILSRMSLYMRLHVETNNTVQIAEIGEIVTPSRILSGEWIGGTQFH